ncbi:MAG: glycosyltransferase family 4 protein [Anaerolineales bacterium]
MDVKTLRILFVHSGSDLYGASRSLLRLSSRLVRDGARVMTVLPYKGPLVEALQANGIEVVIRNDLPVIERERVKNLSGMIGLAVNLFSSWISLSRLMGTFQPHLVHTITSVIPIPGLAAKFRTIPHVWHIRESFGEFGFWWKYYRRYINWLSSVIVCVSAPIAEQFESEVRAGKVTVIHNGFPSAEFAAVGVERILAFKSKFALDKAESLIGVVGRIKLRRKGQEVFVEAAGLLRDQYPNVRFLCVGSPFPGNESHLENLEKLIRERGLADYIICTGDVDDIKAAISALDILVLPSVQPEPFGGVVVEAMALSRPVVASRIGGSIEQVAEDVTGYLVEPGDAKSLADALVKLLEDPDRRRRFGENGHIRFLEKFEFESFYRRILELYEQIVAAGHFSDK